MTWFYYLTLLIKYICYLRYVKNIADNIIFFYQKHVFLLVKYLFIIFSYGVKIKLSHADESKTTLQVAVNLLICVCILCIWLSTI